VAVFGNFVNRAMKLTEKYFGGKVPAAGELTEYDKATLGEFAGVKDEVEHLLDEFKFRDALKAAMELARIGNKYLAETEPWKLAKTGGSPETTDHADGMNRVATILNLSLQISANLAIAFEPFLPFSAEKLRGMLGMKSFEWNQLGRTDLLEEGHQLGESVLLFEKIEDDVIQAQLDRLARIKEENEAAAAAEALKNWHPMDVKEQTTFDEFEKSDIRVGTVLSCEKVKKSDKLLQFRIDDGMGGRTILSGIAQSYPNPEELVGKQILFIANFPPRKMMGIESQGMILSAVNADGKLVLTTVSAEVRNGAQVG
jgi:methionyl-tRNA synthetase